MNASLDELQWKSPEWIQAFGLRTDNVLDYFSESPFFDKTSNNHVIKMQRQFSQLSNDSSVTATNNNNNNSTNTGDSTQQQSNNNSNTDSSSQFLRIPNQEHRQQQELFQYTYVDPLRKEILLRYPLHALLEHELSKLRGIEYVLAAVREPDFWIIRKQNRLAKDQTECLQDYYIIGANVYQAPTMFNIVQSRLMSTGFYLSETLKNLNKLTQFQPAQGIQFRNLGSSSQIWNSNSNSGTGSSGGGGRTVEASTGPATLGPVSVLPTTVGTVMNTVQSVGGSGAGVSVGVSVSGNGNRNGSGSSSSLKDHGISKEMMDKLMIISIKSKPEYI